MDGAPECHRCFAALPLDPALIEKTVALQQRLSSRLSTFLVRWTRAGQLHLTLKFFGGVELARMGGLETALRGACAGTGALDLTLQLPGCFPSAARPSVIWLGIGGDCGPLAALAARIDSATRGFGDHIEKRAFHPHLTIGRVRPGPPRELKRIGASLQTLQAEPLGGWAAANVVLVRSELLPQGSHHTLVARIPLPGLIPFRKARRASARIRSA